MREAYCVELVAQTWFEHKNDFPTNQFLFQLLHLLSCRFNIDEASTQILRQLSALQLSANEEIQTSLPTIENNVTDQLLAELANLTNAFAVEFDQTAPKQEDFAQLSTELIQELIASRYYAVQNYVAKDQNRRRKRSIKTLLSGTKKLDE
ncbi:MAG: hypothetical protein AAF394_08790 [Planctomycetota bacterium]